MISPGEIYWAQVAENLPHPVVVVSRIPLNRGDRVVAVLVTSAQFSVRSRLPNCVPIRAGHFGLARDCVVQAETIAPIPTAHLDLVSGPIGRLDDATLREVVRAIGDVLDAVCEPI